MKAHLIIPFLLLTSACAFAEPAVPTPAPKPLSNEQLQTDNAALRHQLSVESEMMSAYRLRALQAEERLMQQSAETDVTKQEATSAKPK